jgi:hypothetical protein
MSIYAPSFFQPSDADYVPKRREISAISNAIEAEVTTTEDHGYVVGQAVRVIVPSFYGMDIYYQQATVLTVPTTTTFTCDIDTSQLFPFVTPTAPPAFTPAQVVPISGTEINEAT